jgi:hypothetical protein
MSVANNRTDRTTFTCPAAKQNRGAGNLVVLTHDWTAQTMHSSRQAQRYKCTACGVWGYRHFNLTDKTFTPIRPYSDGRTEPDKVWEQVLHDDVFDISDEEGRD